MVQPKHYDLLINFSGGIDSTSVAYNWLKNNPDKKALLHHCVVRMHPDRHRHEKELAAVERVTRWFREHGLVNFDLYTTVYDALEVGGVVADQTVVTFVTCSFLANRRAPVYSKAKKPRVTCSSWAINRSKTDVTYPGFWGRNSAHQKLISLFGLSDITFVYPNSKLTREQVIKSIPRELLGLTWFCQSNREREEPCGKCWTCRRTLRYL